MASSSTSYTHRLSQVFITSAVAIGLSFVMSLIINTGSGDYVNFGQAFEMSLRLGVSIVAFPLVFWMIITALLELKESSKWVTIGLKYIGVAAVMAGISFGLLVMSPAENAGGFDDLGRALLGFVMVLFFCAVLLASLLSILWVKRGVR